MQIWVARMDHRCRVVRGDRHVISVPKNADSADILNEACRKFAAHDKKFGLSDKWTLRYKDGTIVDRLPEGGGPFTLIEYRNQLSRDFQKMVLYISKTGERQPSLLYLHL
jgi:hypothetical protein